MFNPDHLTKTLSRGYLRYRIQNLAWIAFFAAVVLYLYQTYGHSGNGGGSAF